MINIQKYLEFYGNIVEMNQLQLIFTDFNPANATTDSSKIKEKIIRQTGNNGTRNVEIMVPLKYQSKFWKTLEMSLIKCKINLDLNWSKSCVVVATDVPDQSTTFSVTDTKLYIPVVTLSTQGNAKLLE